MVRAMMLAASLAAALGLGSPASAQGLIGSASLGAWCGEDGMQVAFSVRVQGYEPGHPELVGFDLYRREADPCGSSVRLTDSPWARDAASDFTYRLSDDTAAPGRMYEYRVRGVDSNRQPVANFQAWYDVGAFFTTWAGCGADVVAHGTVEHEPGFAYVESCPDACLIRFAPLESWPTGLDPYFGSGVPLQLHADLLCGSIEGCWLRVRSFEVAPCTVALEPAHWSGVKSLYR